jgi:hypothetical protein
LATVGADRAENAENADNADYNSATIHLAQYCLGWLALRTLRLRLRALDLLDNRWSAPLALPCCPVGSLSLSVIMAQSHSLALLRLDVVRSC